jgi:hypothetical protein
MFEQRETMHDPCERFIVYTTTRAQIAKELNLRLVNLKIQPSLLVNDPRLTSEICQAYASMTPVDLGDPSAELLAKDACDTVLRKMGFPIPER